MPPRPDPLPDGTIEERDTIEEKAALLKDGLVFWDNLASYFFTLVADEDPKSRRNAAETLRLWLQGIADYPDLNKLVELAEAIELVVRHIKRDKPYDATALLVAEYIMDADSREEPLNLEAAVDYIRERDPDRAAFDDAYYYKIFRRLGRPLGKV